MASPNLIAAVTAYEAALKAKDDALWEFSAAQGRFREKPSAPALDAVNQAGAMVLTRQADVDALFQAVQEAQKA